MRTSIQRDTLYLQAPRLGKQALDLHLQRAFCNTLTLALPTKQVVSAACLHIPVPAVAFLHHQSRGHNRGRIVADC